MKLLISLVLLLFFTIVFNNASFAKEKEHVFNPKVERESYYDCGWCNNKKGGYCGTMGGCKTVYIYQYPRNIDKMIEENHEVAGYIGKDFDFSIDNTTQIHNCRNKISSYIRDIKNGFKEQIKLLKECNSKNNKDKICSDNIIKCYIQTTDNDVLQLQQKLSTSDEELLKDDICKEELLNPKEISPQTCYQLWRYDSCGSCSTIEIKSYYAMQQYCNKIVKKILKKTGRLY